MSKKAKPTTTPTRLDATERNRLAGIARSVLDSVRHDAAVEITEADLERMRRETIAIDGPDPKYDKHAHSAHFVSGVYLGALRRDQFDREYAAANPNEAGAVWERFRRDSLARMKVDAPRAKKGAK